MRGAVGAVVAVDGFTRLAIVREALQGLITLGELEIRLRDNLIHHVR